MTSRAPRRGTVPGMLVCLAVAVAACGSSGPTPPASGYPTISDTQLRSALLTTADVPAGFTVDPSTTDSGTVDPDVTTRPSNPSGSAAAGPSSLNQDAVCRTLENKLGTGDSGHGGDGSNAYADASFSQKGATDSIDEGLEAFPARNVPLLQSQLNLIKQFMVGCSPFVSPDVRLTVAPLSGPALGTGSTWFTVTIVSEGLTFQGTLADVAVGNVSVSLFALNGTAGGGSTQIVENLTRTAVAKVTVVQRQTGQPTG